MSKTELLLKSPSLDEMMLKDVTWVQPAIVNHKVFIPYTSNLNVYGFHGDYYYHCDWDVSSLKALKRYDHNRMKNQLICVLKIRY